MDIPVTAPPKLDGTFINIMPPDRNGGPIIGGTAYGEDLPGIKINYSSAELGSTSGVYYGFVFQLPKWGYQIEKYDETFEINPTYRQYYADTLAQKQELEGKIKSGMASVSQSVADYEFIEHDLRKYAEMMSQFEKIAGGSQGLSKTKKPEERKKFGEMIKEGNSSLKSMFVDQVDSNAGDTSMLSLARTRWPTIIVDFMQLNDDDATLEKINSRKLGISTAEAHILATKNGLFVEWKRMFRNAVAERYQRLSGLAESRKKSIESYKGWLRPYIVQHEMIKETYEKPGAGGGDVRSYVRLAGHATSYHNIKLWVWKPYPVVELWKGPIVKKRQMVRTEYLDDKYKAVDFMINPYDDFVKDRLYNRTYGLMAEYPWLKEKDIETEVFRILDKSIKDRTPMDPDVMYYAFFNIEFNRGVIQLPIGVGDDLVVLIHTYFVSQNVLLLRLLQLWAKTVAFEKNIDEMLGIKSVSKPGKTVEETTAAAYPTVYGARQSGAGHEKIWAPRKKFGKDVEDFLGKFGINLMLFRGGPYDTNFEERITKQFLSPLGKNYVGEIITLLKSKMGFGQ